SATSSRPSTKQADQHSIPKPLSGRVRHPKGASPLKLAAGTASADLMILRNGTSVAIINSEEQWYRARVGGYIGYLHHNWMLVD
ncbi:SH3 domain-containing protein, partial [Priestia megaterium]|uniref:SH3 domain-containing protein n=1 Tax=Priestia megaterium TaxID=1404 RepID=UPI00372D2E1F